MIGTFRRAFQVRMLETRKRKLELRRDSLLAQFGGDDGEAHLYRHEYPNTPVLEDVFTELDYLEEALAGYVPQMQAGYSQHAAP